MNNLKDVSVEIPKRRLTVFTGVSGPGKSSLVTESTTPLTGRPATTFAEFAEREKAVWARPAAS